jgi:hypothetical protein
VNRTDEFLSVAHFDELEDRAAELVDRDRLLCQERDDLAAGRAELHDHDRAVLIGRADVWEAVKAGSGWQSNWGRSYWDGVL